MRTPIMFASAFFQPMPAHPTSTSSNDRAESSNSSSTSHKPTLEKNYSTEKYGSMQAFYEREGFDTVLEQYKNVLGNITDFVSNHSQDEKNKKTVIEDFGELKKHLSGKHKYDSLVYGLIKGLFHEFSRTLEDNAIPLQDRLNAVLEISDRVPACADGIAGELEETIRGLRASKGGVRGAVYKWKVKMVEELIRQHVVATHRPFHGNEEIHYVFVYYNHFAEGLGLKKRKDRYADNNIKQRITSANMKRCSEKLRGNIKPTGLVDNLAIEYSNQLETVFKAHGIDANNIPHDGLDSVIDIQKAELAPTYGDVPPLIFLDQKDQDGYSSPYVYNGKTWPTGLALHFLKDLKKKELVWYDKDSKNILAETDEGRIKVRENRLWIKKKKISPQEPTLEAWSAIDPGELFDSIKKIEPANMNARAALVRTIVKHVRNLPQTNEAGAMQARWLIHALEKGEFAMLKALLEAGVETEGKDDQGQTILMHAAGKNQLGILNALLKAGANKDAKDNEGRTALMHAAGKNRLGALKVLIKAGADKEAKDNEGRTALMHASINGLALPLKILLKAGAKKKIMDNEGKTAKMHAAEQATRQGNGNAPALRVFTEGRATGLWKSLFGTKKQEVDITAQEVDITAMLTAERVDLDALQVLIDNGANLKVKDKYGTDAVLLAADRGHAAVLRVLIENGADVNLNHLRRAVKKNHVEALRILIDHVGNVDAHDGFRDETLLMYAASKSETNVDSVHVLLESGANVNARNQVNDTALMFAVKSGNVNVVRCLLDNGADIYAQDNFGRTVMDFVGRLGYSKARAIWDLLGRASNHRRDN